MSSELFRRIFSAIILFPIVISIIIYGSIVFNLFLTLCFFIVLYEWHMMSKKKKYYYLGIIFLFFSFYTTYKFKIINTDYINFLFVLLICVSTDIGGYIVGKIFKGPRLTTLSPNKTVSGSLGAYLFSVLFAIIFFQISFIFSEKVSFSINTLLLVIIISTVSQLGDIVISYFKRLSKIKDAGSIIPGHGGLLDRIDGMIFAFPSAYILFLLNMFERF